MQNLGIRDNVDATMSTYVLHEPCPPFVIILWCLLVHGSHTPVSYVHICTKSDHLQACIEPRPPINCCCRLQKCYSCSMSASHQIAAVQNTYIRPLHHSHPFEARSGACKLAGATYIVMHHTYLSIAVPISYHGYMHSYAPAIR